MTSDHQKGYIIYTNTHTHTHIQIYSIFVVLKFHGDSKLGNIQKGFLVEKAIMKIKLRHTAIKHKMVFMPLYQLFL